MKKIKNFPVCIYKSQNVVHSQPNFWPSHPGETVTFRNSGFSKKVSRAPSGPLIQSGLYGSTGWWRPRIVQQRVYRIVQQEVVQSKYDLLG